jgi:hypothetical protein
MVPLSLLLLKYLKIKFNIISLLENNLTNIAGQSNFQVELESFQ